MVTLFRRRMIHSHRGTVMSSPPRIIGMASFLAPSASQGAYLIMEYIFHMTTMVSDLFIISITMLRTNYLPAIPTPVSPVSCLALRWPQPPIPAEHSRPKSQDMTKPNLPLVQPNQHLPYLPTPPASPSTIGPPPSMFALPNETLDRVFSFLPTTTLPTLMRASRLCHALAERQLYFKIQHIQLYECKDNKENKSWQCLRTLASRSSAATSVRHFAVRGLPWLHPSEIDLILHALGNMTKLCSLHLELGAPFERALVRDTLAVSATAGSLCALNVTDAQTALAICRAASGTSRKRGLGREDASASSGGPLTTLRIASDSALDAAAVHELVLALTQGRNGPHASDMQVLQMTVECESEDEFLKILAKLGKSLPSLETLGLQVRSTGQGRRGCDSGFEGGQDKVSDLPRRMGDILALFPSLRKLSLACAPSSPVRMGATQGDAEALVRGCELLELLELQWSAWRAETVQGNQRWEFVSPPPGHPFIRRNWVYEHASIS
jgi:hypothetical protein